MEPTVDVGREKDGFRELQAESSLSGMDDRSGKIFLLMLLGLAVCRHWLMGLRGVLWLDETGSFWVIQQGAHRIYSRALIDMVSPIYSLLLWGTVRVAGAHEWVLRLPSAMAMGLAAFLLYRICARFFDEEAGLLAALVLVCLPNTTFAATYVRSYALAFLASVAAILMLIRWLDSGRVRDVATYVLFAALTVYLHYLFATMLVVHAIYAAQRRRSGGTVTWRAMTLAGLLLILLLLPLGPYLHSLYQARASHTWSPRPEFVQMFEALVPALVFACLALGAWAGTLFWSGFKVTELEMGKTLLLLLGVWIVLPPLLLFLVARLTSAGVFLPRYYLPMNGGLAILAACVMRAIQPRRARLSIAAIVVLASILSYGGIKSFWINHSDDNWRSAAQAVDAITSSAPQTPVFFHIGLVEADDYAWLADPERRSLLLAPLSMYPAHGNTVPIPYTFNTTARQYLGRIVPPLLQNKDRFLFVTKGPDSRLFETWFECNFGQQGFSYRSLGDSGAVSVFLFERKTHSQDQNTQ